MPIYWSTTTNGFYDAAFAGYTLPPDAVEITETQRAALLAAQAGGYVIQAVAGVPTAVAPVVPAPTLIQQAAALLAAGLTTTGSATAVLNQTWRSDPDTIAHNAQIAAVVTRTSAFPGAAATWPIATEAGFVALTVAQFQVIQSHYEAFAGAATAAALGAPVTLPAASVAIA